MKNGENQSRSLRENDCVYHHMMNILITNNQASHEIDLSKLRQVAEFLLIAQHCEERCEVSIALVDDDAIHLLNRQYRGIDRPTDVLSFALQEAEELSPPVIEITEQPFVLGDVIISTDTAQRQADERGHSFEKELWVLLIHGILHLLGYDHETDEDAEEMEALEQRLLNEIPVPVTWEHPFEIERPVHE